MIEGMEEGSFHKQGPLYRLQYTLFSCVLIESKRGV